MSEIQPTEEQMAERIAEIRRLLGIFARGCTNSEIARAEPEACAECTTQIYGFIANVMAGREYDA